MTLSLTKLELYAKTRKTTVIAHRIATDYKSATFVLESGPKLTMTEEEINKAIEDHKKALRVETAVAEVTQAAGETPAQRKAREKAEAKTRKEAKE